jgi:hypothetical protein
MKLIAFKTIILHNICSRFYDMIQISKIILLLLEICPWVGCRFGDIDSFDASIQEVNIIATAHYSGRYAVSFRDGRFLKVFGFIILALRGWS